MDVKHIERRMDGNPEIPDIELVKKFLNGDMPSFEVLYERYKRQLYAYLHRLMPGQHALVDDVFQQTWIKVANQLAKYRHDEKFLAWIIRISHNLAIDHFRRTKNEESGDFSGDDRNPLFSEDKYEPWKGLDRTELADALEKCIQKLSPELREVFLLRQDDIEFREIARIQDCPINTALGRMQYALRSLQKMLSEWDFRRNRT